MKKGIPLLTPTAYFPPAHWIPAAAQAGEWRVEAHENFQKGGFRNRCKIAGPNGIQTLTVPLARGKHQKQPIREVRISYTSDWWREHEQAIRSAYGRAPYYEFYAERLFAVGRKRPETLWALNQELLETLLELLQNPVSISLTDDFVRPNEVDYLRPTDLKDSLAPYSQVFEDRHGFSPGLSVLDALFCLGPAVVV